MVIEAIAGCAAGAVPLALGEAGSWASVLLAQAVPKMDTTLLCLAVILLLAAVLWYRRVMMPIPRGGTQPSDMVIFNARIITCNPDKPTAEAVAVQDGRICFVGTRNDVKDFVGPNTRVINAKDNVFVPGFVDSHCHPLWIGALHALMTNLYAAESLDEVKNIVREHGARYPDNPFVMAIGWKYDHVAGGMPDKALADSIIRDRPLFLWSYDGHTGWVNSSALEVMQSKNPEALQRLAPQTDEKTGEPNGVLLHFWAFNPFDYFPLEELGPEVRERMVEQMEMVLDEAMHVGVTTLNDVQLSRSFMPLVEELRAQGVLEKVRVRCSYYVDHHALEDEAALRQGLEDWKRIGEQQSDDHLILGDSVKLYADGVFANHTAFLLEPYADDAAECGHSVWSQEDLNRAIEIVDAMGLQACTHAIGDAAIRMTLNAYENARQVNGARDAGHRVEHCELPHPDDQKRMADLGVSAVMQPCHVYGDETMERRLGHERLQGWMPWRSLEKAGVDVSFGSDWCAGPINPIYGLALAATRRNYKGSSDWGPAEKVSAASALDHYTLGSARALKMDQDVGSIEVGKCGDFVLFSIDPRKVASPKFMLTHKMELGSLDSFVLLTMVDGKIVYNRPGEWF